MWGSFHRRRRDRETRQGLDFMVFIPVRRASVWPMTKESLGRPVYGAADQRSPNLNFFVYKMNRHFWVIEWNRKSAILRESRVMGCCRSDRSHRSFAPEIMANEPPLFRLSERSVSDWRSHKMANFLSTRSIALPRLLSMPCTLFSKFYRHV
jgi:hypothetical protein